MISRRPYPNRASAGRELADALAGALGESAGGQTEQPVVLALPRGGVPVAVPVAERFGTDVAALVVRKLGAPGQPELAVGAVALVGDRLERVVNPEWVRRLRLSDEQLDRITADEVRELRLRAAAFGHTPPVAGRTTIVVDDGLATGATMRAAVTALRGAGAALVVAAAPVGAVDACKDLAEVADHVVCPWRPDPFYAVGAHYRDFAQLADAEVIRLLRPGR